MIKIGKKYVPQLKWMSFKNRNLYRGTKVVVRNIELNPDGVKEVLFDIEGRKGTTSGRMRYADFIRDFKAEVATPELVDHRFYVVDPDKLERTKLGMEMRKNLKSTEVIMLRKAPGDKVVILALDAHTHEQRFYGQISEKTLSAIITAPGEGVIYR